MFSWFDKPKRHTARINDRTVIVEPGETLLKAALRQGIDYPHHCGSGGCGTCKCRLVDGKVKQLTDSSYVLSAADLARGYILACQSLARSDLSVAADLSSTTAFERRTGRVTGQSRVTRDITRLTVQLDAPFAYRGGQSAELGAAALPEVRRSYSFATAPDGRGQVVFFVRRVPGGKLSSLVHDQDLAGQAVVLEGPAGDFWLRPSEAPLLLVAGGSGLAPILALLDEAASQGCRRSTTLLFGARTEGDLYALEEIEQVRRRWGGSFRFVPVLSEGTRGDGWGGERGLVTDLVPSLVEPEAACYLCGPPGMLDAALRRLEAAGVDRERIFMDRFVATTAPTAPTQRRAG